MVCAAAELPPGERRIVEAGGRSIGVFNVGGTYYALRNSCPHKAAPLCLGPITGLVTGPEPQRFVVERQGEVVRCPWHGWEFDILTGRSLYNPHRVRVRSYDVAVEPEMAETAEPEDPAIETFPVAVEREMVVVYLGR